MYAARITAYVLLGTLAILGGLFFLVGSMLPGERDFAGERTVCHDAAAVQEALSEPRKMAPWLFTHYPDPEIHDNRLRWRSDSDRPWVEIRIRDTTPENIRYALEQENRFVIPITVRLETLSGQEAGTRLQVSGHAGAETLTGRWVLVAPRVLDWFGLPNQSFEEAVDMAVNPLEEHLGDCSDPSDDNAETTEETTTSP